jgi:N-acetylglucosaminyldiphosphoundecaprenol N-acetyl-beta-D-mannosaminyltransferase
MNTMAINTNAVLDKFERQFGGPVVSQAGVDDLSRKVYCVLGMPIDAIDRFGVLNRIDHAANVRATLFISTPNLNYLVQSYSDPEFRDALLLSDLCPADGTPIVWLGRLLGVPIKERVAGSDIFAALKGLRPPEQPLRVFLFGGNEGVAAAASDALNGTQSGVVCVGWHFPGYLSVEELSQESVISAINSVDTDFLVVCLGSKKGQLWLKRNFKNLRAPICSHLGASLNFEAGTVKRAPVLMQKLGLEWVWRIKEEPYLWRRYWHDGLILLGLTYSRILPILIYRIKTKNLSKGSLTVYGEKQDGYCRLSFVGAATSINIDQLIEALRTTLSDNRRIVIDLTDVSAVDARCLGLLLVFRKMVRSNSAELVLTGVSSSIERIIRLSGADVLLAPQEPQSNEALTVADSSSAQCLFASSPT